MSPSLLRFLSFVCVLTTFSAILSGTAFSFRQPSLSTTDPTPQPIVVLDAGHGGEDGGAVSSTGIIEKDLNLSIALQLCELLTANGIEVVMTRTDDRLLYDPTSDYKGHKKALDLAARRQIAEENKEMKKLLEEYDSL